MKPSPRTLVILLVIIGCLSVGVLETWVSLAEFLEIQPFLFHKITVLSCAAALFSLLFAGFWICQQRTSKTSFDRYRVLIGIVTGLIGVFGVPAAAGFFMLLSNIFPGFTKINRDKLLALMFLTGFVWFGACQYLHNLKKLSHVSDTPTSKIRSAAQGYVELSGTLIQVEGQSLLRAPLSNSACLWWEYEIEKLEYKNTHTIETGSSDDLLRLVDETGQCNINPHGADVKPHQDKDWKVNITRQQLKTAIPLTPLGKPLAAGGYRYIEKLLLSGQELYALGDFRSRSGQHLLAKPEGGQPFVLSGESEDEVIGSARSRAAWGAILCIVGTIGALSVVWSML